MATSLDSIQESEMSDSVQDYRFHIHVVNTTTGRRRRYTAEKEAEAITLANKKSDDQNHAHVYDTEEEDGNKYKRIYTTAPEQKR